MSASTLNIISYCLLLGILLLVTLLAWAWRPWIRVAAFRGKKDKETSGESGPDVVEGAGNELPRLSVILYAENAEDDITDCVRELEQQDYPDKEIVVVCRTTSETRDVISARLAGHENVYVTFIPPDSHNLSERKLAITLGLKAAKGEIVLTTSTNIRPLSEHWLSDMAAPFANPEIELVLGCSRMDFDELSGPGRWYRQFDSVLTDGMWIGYALSGHPYRGDGLNLAFRRSTFFAHKGYARNIFLHYGDDDLFVHQIADSGNTAVVINPGSVVTSHWGEGADRAWTLRKSRYQFTSRWLPQGPFMRASLVSWCNWLILGCCVAAVLLGWHDWINIVFPATCWLAVELFQITFYRRMAAALGAVRLWWAVPVFFLTHPVANAIFKLKNLSLRKVNYTWQH